MTSLLLSLVILIGGIACIIGIFFIVPYNSLVTLRNRYQNAFSQIDVQLQRRYDLIPNLVETAKGYMKHERDTLEAVVTARNQAITASRRAAADPSDGSAMEQLGNSEAALTGALGRLMAIAEAYPDLKADSSMNKVMEELSSTENRVAFARQAFNDSVTVYNTKREVFPSNFIAQLFNFLPGNLLEEVAPEVREVPRVSFS